MNNPQFERPARFGIGTTFQTRGKHPRECEVIDIYRTYNSKGDLVKLAYRERHYFFGQTMESEVNETTIAMGLIKEEAYVA